MTIPIIDADECVTRGRGTKNAKYGRYAIAIAKSVPWIKEEIARSKDGTIRIKVSDMANELGADFVKKHPTSIIWGLKYVMFNHGIVVDAGTHKDDSTKLLVMRIATNDDRLPASLQKYLEPTEAGDEEETEDEKDE